VNRSQVVERTLQRFEEKYNPDDFALRFVRVNAQGNKKKSRLPGILSRRSSGALILAPEDHPLLVADTTHDGQKRRQEKFSSLHPEPSPPSLLHPPLRILCPA
jgi:hypothetical protein